MSTHPLDIDTLCETLATAYRQCETPNQRRGTERAAAAIAKAISDRYPGFSRPVFLAHIKGKYQQPHN